MTQADISRHMRTLGVNHGATAEAVRKAWRNAVLKSHPDISGSGSTDKMVRINAAYEFLKNGVPEPTPMRNPDADRGSRTTSHTDRGSRTTSHTDRGSRTTSNHGAFWRNSSFKLRDAHMVSTEDQRKRWTEVARAELASQGLRFEEGGWIRRTLGIRKKIPIFVPHDFKITGDILELILQDRSMKKGPMYIYVPYLTPRNGSLMLNGSGHLFELTLKRNISGLYGYRAYLLDDIITPGFEGLKVFFSTV